MKQTSHSYRCPILARRKLIAPLAFAVLSGPVALAQTDAAEDSAETAEPTVDRIEVTARRRVELLNEVPSSVSVFGDSRLKDRQADQLNDIQYAVPNLYFEPGDGSNAVIFMRGIGQNDSLSFVDSGVAVYLDDVFIARSQAAFLDVFDVERIEVLRGPQGTLYGRNSPGGAIKFISSPPPDHLTGDIEAGLGNFGERIFKGRVGGPILGQKLRGKLAIAGRHHDGFARNDFLGGQDGDTESFAWRGSLAWNPSRDLELTFTADGKVDRPDTSRSPIRVT
ncbi:MAG: TonB-dependent receptor, partial [Wenzhouxiangella sp.]